MTTLLYYTSSYKCELRVLKKCPHPSTEEVLQQVNIESEGEIYDDDVMSFVDSDYDIKAESSIPLDEEEQVSD